MSTTKPIFVSGIGTGIGKTIVSAILVEHLKADYWKPVQSGDLDNSDTLAVRNLISNPQSVFHPETYRLTQPYSPHKSADLDGIKIKLDNFVIPETDNTLIIEGAGGLMVPLNDEHFIIDLIKKFEAEVVLVSRNYLGSINHTLLSAALLKQHNLTVKGIIFNGERDEYSENRIISYTGFDVLGYVPNFESLDKDAIKHFAGLKI